MKMEVVMSMLALYLLPLSQAMAHSGRHVMERSWHDVWLHVVASPFHLSMVAIVVTLSFLLGIKGVMYWVKRF